jgi:kinesin family protein 5
LNDEQQKGIIPRVMDHLFELISDTDENLEFTIRVSMLEIYNEKIKDLLDPKKDNLKIVEDKVRGIMVDDCTEVYVASGEEMKKVMLQGNKNRSVASTRMNEVSSRSHSIFMLMID